MYPALAVLQAIQGNVEALWVGGEGGMEAQLVERSGISFKAIPAAGVHGISLRTLPRNLWQLSRGLRVPAHPAHFQARRAVLHRRIRGRPHGAGRVENPQPALRSGYRTGTGIEHPGPLRRYDCHYSRCLSRYFKHSKRITLTGYPTRADLTKWTRPDARRSLNLTDESPVLLVLGGSKGAHSINNAVLANLPALVEMAQVIHITGELDWPNIAGIQSARYHAFPYLHEQMGAALAAADLVVSRAGASTLGEYPLFGLPAVLVPYPHAWRYQQVNANYLTQRGAAVMLDDGKISEQFLPTVVDLLNQPQKLASMRAAMQRLCHPEAAAEISRQLLALCPGEESRS